jgi:hypothetical protein
MEYLQKELPRLKKWIKAKSLPFLFSLLQFKKIKGTNLFYELHVNGDTSLSFQMFYLWSEIQFFL